jgi:hypothetical protein
MAVPECWGRSWPASITRRSARGGIWIRASSRRTCVRRYPGSSVRRTALSKFACPGQKRGVSSRSDGTTRDRSDPAVQHRQGRLRNRGDVVRPTAASTWPTSTTARGSPLPRPSLKASSEAPRRASASFRPTGSSSSRGGSSACATGSSGRLTRWCSMRRAASSGGSR